MITFEELCGKKKFNHKELKGLHKGYTKYMNYKSYKNSFQYGEINYLNILVPKINFPFHQLSSSDVMVTPFVEEV